MACSPGRRSSHFVSCPTPQYLRIWKSSCSVTSVCIVSTCSLSLACLVISLGDREIGAYIINLGACRGLRRERAS